MFQSTNKRVPSITRYVTEEKVQHGAATYPTVSSMSVATNMETSAYTGPGDDCILSIIPV